jgi:hypothetical protein
MELNFKTVAFLMLLLGGGYAWYAGLLDGFFSGFSNNLGPNKQAADQIDD